MYKLILEETNYRNEKFINIVYFEKKLENELENEIKNLNNVNTDIKENILTLPRFKNNSIICWIKGKIKIYEKFLNIIFLETNEIYRNKGFASKILKDIALFVKYKYELQYIYLDDTTEAEPPHNIYCKLGFEIDTSLKPGWTKKWAVWKECNEMHEPIDCERRIKIEKLIL